MTRALKGWGVIGVLALAAGVARAEDAPKDGGGDDVAPATPVQPTFDHASKVNHGLWVIEEHPLVPAERTTRTPAHWTGDPEPRREDPDIAAERDRGEQFVQPFFLSSVRPEFGMRLSSAGGTGERAGAELDQQVLLSFWYVEAAAPLFSLRAGNATSADAWRVNAKLPLLQAEHQALTLALGVLLPFQGTLAKTGGYNSYLGWAYGSGMFAAQLRVGVGIDRIVGDILAAPRPLMLYDGVAAVRFTDWLQGIAQVDGTSGIAGSVSNVRLMPGVRLFPLSRQTLSVGAAFLAWFDKPGADWDTRRLGLTVDLGYLFL